MREEITTKGANINIIGDSHIYIENYKKILKYSKEEIIISDKCKKVFIQGTNMNIRYFFDSDIHISGQFISISFKGLFQ